MQSSYYITPNKELVIYNNLVPRSYRGQPLGRGRSGFETRYAENKFKT